MTWSVSLVPSAFWGAAVRSFSEVFLLSLPLAELKQIVIQVDLVGLKVPLSLEAQLGHWDLVIHSVHAGQGLLSVLSFR